MQRFVIDIDSTVITMPYLVWSAFDVILSRRRFLCVINRYPCYISDRAVHATLNVKWRRSYYEYTKGKVLLHSESFSWWALGLLTMHLYIPTSWIRSWSLMYVWRMIIPSFSKLLVSFQYYYPIAPKAISPLLSKHCSYSSGSIFVITLELLFSVHCCHNILATELGQLLSWQYSY